MNESIFSPMMNSQHSRSAVAVIHGNHHQSTEYKLADVSLYGKLSADKSDEDVLVTVSEDEKPDVLDTSDQNLRELLEQEKQHTLECQDKLKHVLADFQNLSRKTQSDIENGINTKLTEFMLEFLKIYDDFERAKQAFFERGVDVEGLNSILKNMNSMMAKYGVKPIDALGKIFDPNLHEAIHIIQDPALDEDTITNEIRKGYISHNVVIRPTLVEISKKSKVNDDE